MPLVLCVEREVVLWSVSKTCDQRTAESESNHITLDSNDSTFMACVMQFVTIRGIHNEVEDEITWFTPSSGLINPSNIVQEPYY